MKPADRMKYFDSSGIRKVFDLASKMTDPINLSIGQPDFDVPEEIKEAAIQQKAEGEKELAQIRQELHERERHLFREIVPLIDAGNTGNLVSQDRLGDEEIDLGF